MKGRWNKKWERLESYSPKFVENIVQAISRDIFMYSMKMLSTYRIVAHVHDEVLLKPILKYLLLKYVNRWVKCHLRQKGTP